MRGTVNGAPVNRLAVNAAREAILFGETTALQGVTSVVAGNVLSQASLSHTTAPNTVVAVGLVSLLANLSHVLNPNAVVALGSVFVRASANVPLGANTLQASTRTVSHQSTASRLTPQQVSPGRIVQRDIGSRLTPQG